MRLIRLYKDYEANIPLGRIANFNNNFQSDLVLAPNSQIALQSVAIDTVDPSFTIDSTNSTLQWSITDADDEFNSFLIASGEYNSTNVNTLLTQLTDGFNASTGFDMYTNAPELLRYYLGMEWLVNIDISESNKISIAYKIGLLDLARLEALRIATDVVITTDQNSRDTFELSGQPTYGSTTLVKNIINTHYISRGCGCVRAQGMVIKGNPDVGSNGQGFIVGLLTDGDLNPEDITLADIKYGIHYTIFANGIRKYHVILDGVRSETADEAPNYTEADTTNDIQEVMVNADGVFFNIYQNGVPQPVVLNADEGVGLGNGGVVPYNGEKLYPVLVFFSGSNFVSVDNFICTESPYQVGVAPDGGSYPVWGPALQPVPNANFTSLTEISDNDLIFETTAIAEFFGFDNRFNGVFLSGPTSRRPEKTTTRNYEFPADKKFNPLYYADSFLVELRNIALDSYDGLKEQRKNVLAYISHSDADGSFNYEVNNPVFIDLNNKKELLLRNLEANLLYGDYSEFAIQSDATMILLIKEKGE